MKCLIAFCTKRFSGQRPLSLEIILSWTIFFKLQRYLFLRRKIGARAIVRPVAMVECELPVYDNRQTQTQTHKHNHTKMKQTHNHTLAQTLAQTRTHTLTHINTHTLSLSLSLSLSLLRKHTQSQTTAAVKRKEQNVLYKRCIVACKDTAFHTQTHHAHWNAAHRCIARHGKRNSTFARRHCGRRGPKVSFFGLTFLHNTCSPVLLRAH